MKNLLQKLFFPSLLLVIALISLMYIIRNQSEIWETRQKRYDNLQKIRSDLQEISLILELYRSENGAYPTSEEGLEVLTKPRKKGGSYLKGIPLDPWGRAYRYHLTEQQYSLFSYGADGQIGGEEEDSDIHLKNLENDQ